MIEVFKTSVRSAEQAALILVHLQRLCPDYLANFDLEDADAILRIKVAGGTVDAPMVISALNSQGFSAEVLQDELAWQPE